VIDAYDALPAGTTLILNARFGSALATVVVAMIAARVVAQGSTDERALGNASFALALVGLLVACSVEVYEQFPLAAQTALSITWGIYAASLIVIGFVVDRRAWRLAALGLLGLTAVKLLLLDLAELEQIYRVLSFAVAGVLMIGVSYLYHHVDQRYARERDATGAR
jgi:hypothetical protein